MLRAEINEALKSAMKARNRRATSTLRLILAALKDRDIAARGKSASEEISDDEILDMLQKMIRQRGESIAYYKKGGRADLVQEETEEIEIIERFLPPQLGKEDMTEAIKEVIAELGADGIKDMGRTMAELKRSYAGRMDFAKASAIVKQRLSGG